MHLRHRREGRNVVVRVELLHLVIDHADAGAQRRKMQTRAPPWQSGCRGARECTCTQCTQVSLRAKMHAARRNARAHAGMRAHTQDCARTLALAARVGASGGARARARAGAREAAGRGAPTRTPVHKVAHGRVVVLLVEVRQRIHQHLPTAPRPGSRGTEGSCRAGGTGALSAGERGRAPRSCSGRDVQGTWGAARPGRPPSSSAPPTRPRSASSLAP